MRLVPVKPRTAAGTVLALTVALTGCSVPVAAPAAAAESRTALAVADAYVSAQAPATSYGASPRLWVDGSPAQRSYLRFDVPRAGSLVRGRLQLYVTGSAQSFEVRRVQDTRWRESGLTYANAPAVGSVVVRSGRISPSRWLPSSRWVTIDVTSLLPASGPVSLALTPVSGTSQTIASREAGAARAPRLLLDQSGALPAAAVVAASAVTATVETEPVPSAGDAADDVAVWVHPTDPDLSTVIGTNKLGGLAVYDLAGRQLSYYADSRPNNVDIRYDFPLGGKPETIVVTSDRDTDALRVYRVDPATRGLEHVSARTLSVGIGLYGLCMYRSATSGKHYVFDSDSSGTLQQWELFDNGGKVDARKVRQVSVGTTAEGCVADDETGALYVAEEDVAIWRYDAEPTGGSTRTSVDAVGAGRLVADIEGLALYAGAGGAGYLVASSQGSSTYAVYDRRPPNRPVTTFRIGAGAVDAVSSTDGLDIVSAPLGSRFPEGVLIAQDDRNDDGNQNFKLVPWGAVARSLSPASPPAVAAATAGSTYYVDAVSGDDSRGGTSPDTAWRSLTKANAVVLTPGASLLLARGSVFSGALKPSGSGTSTAPVVVGAYGTGAAPVVRDASTCVAVAGSWVVVRDLEVRACSWAGIALSGTGSTVERNTVTDTAAGVYVKEGALDNRVLRNRLLDNNRMSVLTAESSSDDSGAFGVLLRGDRTEVAWNTISGSDAFSYDYGRDGAAVEVVGAIGSSVHHNVAVDNDAFAELGSSRSADNVFAYNEVRSSLPTSVFLVTRGAESSYGPVRRTRLYNNTVHLTGAESQGFVCHAGCGPDILTMRNNVVQAVAKAGYADAPFDEGNGVYYGGNAQFALSATSVVAAPGFVDAAGGDLRLSASSPAVDSGAPSGFDVDLDGLATPVDGNGDGVAASDLGAYERR